MSDFIGRFDFLTDHNYAASSSDNHEVYYMAEDWVFWNLCTLLWNWWEISLDFTRKDKTTLLLVSRSSKLCAKKGWAGLRRPHESGGEQRPCKLHEGPRRRRRHALRTWRHCRRWSCSIAQKIEIGTVSSRTWHGHGESDKEFVVAMGNITQPMHSYPNFTRKCIKWFMTEILASIPSASNLRPTPNSDGSDILWRRRFSSPYLTPWTMFCKHSWVNFYYTPYCTPSSDICVLDKLLSLNLFARHLAKYSWNHGSL